MPESTIGSRLGELKRRADEDFADPTALRTAGRHQIELAELGLRVSLTRSRYSGPGTGTDQYALTLTRRALDHRPDDADVRMVLATAFGDAANRAVERSSGPIVRLFRIPADGP